MALELPELVMSILKRVSSATGMPPEEIVSELVVERFSNDADTRIQLYLELHKKYLREAEEMINRGNYLQASEKIWGAAASIVKAAAMKKLGRRPASHGELWKFVVDVARETGDDELRLLWKEAMSMHVNFYENWAPPEDIRRSLKSVKKFAEKMARYAGLDLGTPQVADRSANH